MLSHFLLFPEEWFLKSDMVMLNYVPQLHGVKKATGRGEYIFIVDRSGRIDLFLRTF